MRSASTLADGSVTDPAALKSELETIAVEVKTASGAPVADSVAYEAARVLTPEPASWKVASDLLTVGLSASE